jgi:hypothetical protein
MRNLVLPFIIILSFVPLASACDSFLDLGGNDDEAPPAADAKNPMPEGPGKAASSALTTYCTARKSYADKCSATMSTCDLAEGKECLATYAIYRDEYTKALTTCGSGFSDTCSGPSDSDEKYNCVIDERDKIAPTTAMTTLAADLCKSCPSTGGKPCPGDTFFFHGKRLPNGGITVSGQGAKFDMYTEEVIAKLRDGCLAKAKGTSCWQSFYSCVDAEIAKLTPSSVKNACSVDTNTGVGVPPAAPPALPVDAGGQ